MQQRARARDLIFHPINIWGVLFLTFAAHADFPNKVFYYNWGKGKDYSSFTLYSDGSFDVQESSDQGVEILLNGSHATDQARNPPLPKEEILEWINTAESAISSTVLTTTPDNFQSFGPTKNDIQTGELAYFPLSPREDKINNIYLYGRLSHYTIYSGRGFARLDFQSPVSAILAKINSYVTHKMEDLSQENAQLIEAAKTIKVDQVFSFKWGTPTEQTQFIVFPGIEEMNTAGIPSIKIPPISVTTIKPGSDTAFQDIQWSLEEYNDLIQTAETMIANSTISKTPLSAPAKEGEDTGTLFYTPRSPRADGIEKICFVYKAIDVMAEDPTIGFVSLDSPMGASFLEKFNKYAIKKMPTSP